MWNRRIKTRSSPTTILKVPHGAYKAANEKGMLQEFLFYYQIKSINTQGNVKQKCILSLLAARTGYSEVRYGES
jgi:hypothetical protein